MGKGGIPDRWLEYTPVGRQIEGTRFIAFKVPLKAELSETIDIRSRLDIKKLLHKIPNLGLVIDLTNTYRYYDADQFTRNGVQHKKLMIPGHVTPPGNLRREFCKIVQRFLDKNKHNDKLIGVHCTHGVNRTGFFICHQMVSDLAMDPTDAIKRFEKARGHRIERKNYLEELYRTRKSKHNLDERKAKPIFEGNHVENWREKGSSFSPRRSSQNKAVSSYTRQTSDNDSSRRNSYNEKVSYNPRNPFRRDPIYPTSQSFEGEGLSRNEFKSNSSFSYTDVVRSSIPSQNHFNEDRKVNDSKNPFKADDRLTNKYNREKFREEVYRSRDNEKNQFLKRRRSPDNEGNSNKKGGSKYFNAEGPSQRSYEQFPERNHSTSSNWRKDNSNYKNKGSFHNSQTNFESRRRQRNDSVKEYPRTRP